MPMMIHDFRSDNLDRNMAKDPNHTLRCEMCWKPLYAEKNKIRNVIVSCPINKILPETETDITPNSTTIPIGPSCYTKLRKYAKEFNFIVTVKKINSKD